MLVTGQTQKATKLWWTCREVHSTAQHWPLKNLCFIPEVWETFVAKCSSYQRHQTKTPALSSKLSTPAAVTEQQNKELSLCQGWYPTGISLFCAPDLLALPVLLQEQNQNRGSGNAEHSGYLPRFAPGTALHEPEKPWKAKVLLFMRRTLWVWIFILFWLRVQGWFAFVHQFFSLFSPVTHLTLGHLLKSLIRNAREMNLTLNFLRTSPPPD